MSNKLDTSYKSKLYYDVVIKTGKYKGFSTSWVGHGTMLFTNGKDIIKVEESSHKSVNWMKECWEQFVEEVKDNK